MTTPVCPRYVGLRMVEEMLATRGIFHLHRDHVSADQYRAARTQAFQSWAEVTGLAAAA